MYYNLRGLFLFRCLKKALADYFRLYFTTTRTYGPNTTCRTQPADWLSRMTGSVVEWSADLIVANCARPAQVWGYVRSTEAPVVDNLISRLRLVRRTIRLVTCKQTARPVGSSRYISSTHFKRQREILALRTESYQKQITLSSVSLVWSFRPCHHLFIELKVCKSN